MSTRKPQVLHVSIPVQPDEVLLNIEARLALIAGLELDWVSGDADLRLTYDPDIHTEDEAFDYLAEALVENDVDVLA